MLPRFRLTCNSHTVSDAGEDLKWRASLGATPAASAFPLTAEFSCVTSGGEERKESSGLASRSSAPAETGKSWVTGKPATANHDGTTGDWSGGVKKARALAAGTSGPCAATGQCCAHPHG